MHLDLDRYLHDRRAIVEQALGRALDAMTGTPPSLLDGMRYALLGGGKRLRPILALAACEAVGGRDEDALDAACALEMIHTYSLVHDDLPCMDDDDFRRGRATTHKVYGEAAAILIGDALLTDAFRVAAGATAGTTDRLAGREPKIAAVLVEIARAAGAAGMVGGQVIDINLTGKKPTLAQLEELHDKKTGALLAASVRVGAILGGATPEVLDRLSRYGRALGLAFQIVDDVLDITADLATLGKDPGSDREAGKTTFVDLLGVDGAKARARDVMQAGLDALAPLGDRAAPLAALARYTIERDR